MNFNAERSTVFYKISMDDSDSAAIGDVEENTRGFDAFRFLEGQIIKDWPEGITFTYGSGQHAEDWPLAAPYWTLVSEHVRCVFLDHDIEGVQFLPVRAMHKATNMEPDVYWALHVWREVDALDWERTMWTTSDPSKIKERPTGHILRHALLKDRLKDIDVFRLNIRGKGSFPIFLSQRLKQWLETAEATSGCLFLRVSAY